jgi:hypothetical protein
MPQSSSPRTVYVAPHNPYQSIASYFRKANLPMHGINAPILVEYQYVTPPPRTTRGPLMMTMDIDPCVNTTMHPISMNQTLQRL